MGVGEGGRGSGRAVARSRASCHPRLSAPAAPAQTQANAHTHTCRPRPSARVLHTAIVWGWHLSCGGASGMEWVGGERAPARVCVGGQGQGKAARGSSLTDTRTLGLLATGGQNTHKDTDRQTKKESREQASHRHQELGLLAARDGRAHGHCLCRGGGLVQQRGVAHRHASQLTHHGLVVEQGLEAAQQQSRVWVGGEWVHCAGGRAGVGARALGAPPTSHPPTHTNTHPCRGASRGEERKNCAHRPWLISAW